MLTLESLRFRRDMRELGERKLQRATVFALTDAAGDVHGMVVDRMKRRFDRPTPFTLRSFRVKRADVREQDPTATVLQKDAVSGRHWVAIPPCQGSCPPLYFSSISQVGGIGR